MATSHRDTLIEEHLDRAYKYAASIARNYRHLDVCDVRSAAHMALIRSASRYCDQGSTFWAYARHYVQGAIKDLVRKPSLPYLADCGDQLRAPSDNIEPRIEIRQLLAQLPARGRSVLISYDLEGFTLRQIGASMGISECHVGRIRRNMLDKLRKRQCTATQSNVITPKRKANERGDT